MSEKGRMRGGINRCSGEITRGERWPRMRPVSAQQALQCRIIPHRLGMHSTVSVYIPHMYVAYILYTALLCLSCTYTINLRVLKLTPCFCDFNPLLKDFTSMAQFKGHSSVDSYER